MGAERERNCLLLVVESIDYHDCLCNRYGVVTTTVWKEQLQYTTRSAGVSTQQLSQVTFNVQVLHAGVRPLSLVATGTRLVSTQPRKMNTTICYQTL